MKKSGKGDAIAGREEFTAAMQELFAEEGKRELRKALRTQPIQFFRLMSSMLPEAGNGQSSPLQGAKRGTTDARVTLGQAELDDRARILVRALGKERLTRILREEEEQGRI